MREPIVPVFIILTILLSCKTGRQPQSVGCNPVGPMARIDLAGTLDRLDKTLPQKVNRDYITILREEVYAIAPMGEGYIDDYGQCQFFSVVDWFRSINNSEGGGILWRSV